VWPVVVVIVHPYLGLFPYLDDMFTDIFVQDTSSIASIEPFHKSILGWFARLYIFEPDAVHLAPSCRDLGDELGTVVHPYPVGFYPSVDKMVQDPYDTVAGLGEVYLDMLGLPVIVVDNVECPKASLVLQYVGYKIHTPHTVGFGRDFERIFYTRGQPFLYLSSQRQP
jgi:hypothetical protein